MQRHIPIIAALTVLMMATLVFAAQNMGAEKLTLEGGYKGVVTFPHRMHQKTLKDCRSCHTLFPQESGAIIALKAKKELKKKQVMKKLCLKCHRQMRKEGQKTGPTACAKCHTR